MEMAEEGGGALFEAAVAAVLRGWPALKMAVSHQFGGPHSPAKATWMEGATAQWMRENVNIQSDELETFLETLLDQEFDTIVDDGSIPEVSRRICDLYQKCCSGDNESVRTFLVSHSSPLPPSHPPSVVPTPSVGEVGEGTTVMEEGDSGAVGEVVMEEEDEEGGGWVVARNHRRKSKK